MNAHVQFSSSPVYSGLLTEAQVVEILRQHVGIEHGAVVGLEEAASALTACQPPHITILAEVAAERQRQIAVEGWTSDHDDRSDHRELVAAGLAYLDPKNQSRKRPPKGWPWERQWWKAKGYRRNFIRGMALLVANIEQRGRESARRRR